MDHFKIQFPFPPLIEPTLKLKKITLQSTILKVLLQAITSRKRILTKGFGINLKVEQECNIIISAIIEWQEQPQILISNSTVLLILILNKDMKIQKITFLR